jgi:hypothetical protein
MERNDIIVFEGRRYLVVGFDPMSVRPRRVYLEDVRTREARECLYEDLLRRVQDVSRGEGEPDGQEGTRRE